LGISLALRKAASHSGNDWRPPKVPRRVILAAEDFVAPENELFTIILKQYLSPVSRRPVTVVFPPGKAKRRNAQVYEPAGQFAEILVYRSKSPVDVGCCAQLRFAVESGVKLRYIVQRIAVVMLNGRVDILWKLYVLGEKIAGVLAVNPVRALSLTTKCGCPLHRAK
jgi:hypothetical protein